MNPFPRSKLFAAEGTAPVLRRVLDGVRIPRSGIPVSTEPQDDDQERQERGQRQGDEDFDVQDQPLRRQSAQVPENSMC